MSPVDLTARDAREELMDDPDVSREEMARALEELETINRLLGGHRTSIAGLRALLGNRPDGGEPITVLDVGAGGADVGRRAVAWARRRGLSLRWVALDRSEHCLGIARARADPGDSFDYLHADLFDLDPRERSFDVVHASLVLHHFDGADAARALAAMHRLSRHGVVVNDLHRHRLAWVSIAILTRLFSRSRLVRNDAPLSVLRAFRRDDWENLARDAGLPTPSVRWRWAFRWAVVFGKEAGR